MSVLLTATFTRLDGTPASGTVRVTPSRSPIMDPEDQIIISGPQMFPLQADGSISISLPASDDPLLGEAFTYTVVASMTHANWTIRGLELPVGSVTVDLSDPPSGIVREYPTRAEWTALTSVAVAEMAAALTSAETAAGRAEFAAEEAEATIVASGDWSGAVDLTSVAARPNYLRATLTGNTTITLPTPASGRAFTVTLDLTQDATGGRTLALPGVATAWAVGIVPHPAPASRSIIHLMWTGVTWVGMMAATNIGIPAGGAI